MNSWNGFDFLIFLIFAANTILGMSRGAVKEIISMSCLCVALIFTIKFTVPLAVFLNKSPLITTVVDNSLIRNFMLAIGAGPLTVDILHQIAYSISMLICFVGVFSICEGALSLAGTTAIFSFPYAMLNRKVGAALGCTRGYVISIIVICIVTLHVLKDDNSLYAGSFFVNLFSRSSQTLDELIKRQHPDAYMEIFGGKDLFPADNIMNNISNTVVPLPQSQSEPQPQSQQ